jgi:hypothetical protein
MPVTQNKIIPLTAKIKYQQKKNKAEFFFETRKKLSS